MRTFREFWRVTAISVLVGLVPYSALAQSSAPLPAGVKAVWDVDKAHRETTSTREQVCVNGLWRWQPADPASERVPTDRWGYFKVPGCWPGVTNYMQKDCQTIHGHPSWADRNPRDLTAAWYEREITIPEQWDGRDVVLRAEYVNSYATVFVDGRKAGEIRFPWGEADLSSVCRPGGRHVLSLLVVAMPLKGVMLSYNDTASARKVKGRVARRGLCGDVFLVGRPAGPRIADVKVDTSVRKGEIGFDVALRGLPDASCRLRARITDGGGRVKECLSPVFRPEALKDGRLTFIEKWQPEKLWDVHTPGNQLEAQLSLLDTEGQALDVSHPVRFGFRELWIDGRDFYLNGTRIFLCAVPLDNAQISAASATYTAARESLRRLQSYGINFVYTHNYGCEPGSHLGFSEILRAADDVGMLVSFSQPHFGHYEWEDEDADTTNGYADHAAFYVRMAQNHPSVVMYSMSHNATGYSEDMNPYLIDGIHDQRSEWSAGNVAKARRASAIVGSLDASRIVYHHSSGNLGPMHTVNFYPNFVPIQEMSDWFGHWGTEGVKPVFTCEYGAPFSWDWTLYRGWFRGRREFGSATVPWSFCVAEWNAQFFGEAAYRTSEEEKRNLRWEAEQFRSGRLWHRWDYPHQVGSRDFDERYPVFANYLNDNWRAFRTWGVSATSPWEHRLYWRLRDGVDKSRRELETDWTQLQRPGFSPDYLDQRYERMDLAFDRKDWTPTIASDVFLRNNAPVLAYVAGKPGAFTSKDHNFLPGETLEKQIVVVNNSRATVTCDVAWTLSLPRPVKGTGEVSVATGDQIRIPVRVKLPGDLPPGPYALKTTAVFSEFPNPVEGEDGRQEDEFTLHVLSRRTPSPARRGTAVFDPRGETTKLLTRMGYYFQIVPADADLSPFDTLVVGKAALTRDGPAPSLASVPTGLKVVVFEQTADALEKRLGFRVQEYGLRQVFPRLKAHPVLAGLGVESLRDWRGEATILPPRLEYELNPTFNYTPTIEWCGMPAPRLWRCGNRGNVASVLIEKPAGGDFLPVLDGGFSLQYAPLLEYREGRGMVLFCQMDVTGRTEEEPAAGRLCANLLAYVAGWKPTPDRRAVYVGTPAGRAHLESAGVTPGIYGGGVPAPDQVLVVGSGGGKILARNSGVITEWLKAGGHLLGLELGAEEANPLLPEPVSTVTKEHISTFFEPFPADSLLAGVSPADVHNRDPRELPLVSAGAEVVGNGVLAHGRDSNVVLCQIAPYSVSAARGSVPSMAVTGEDVADGKQSAVLNMGTAAWAQFGQKVKAGQVGKTYTFALSLKALDAPVRARLEVERAASPWDRAVRGEDTLVGADEWSDLHVTFRVEKPYPQGWSAYLHCGQEGARLRADNARLCEGDYSAGTAPAPGNLFTNASFEEGTDPWFFSYRTQRYNLRQTYRRTSFLLTRLLANMGVRGQTPLLARFSTPATGPVRTPVTRNGDFRLDSDGDGVPDDWQLSATSTQEASCVLEEVAPDSGEPCLRIACTGFGDKERGSTMLAQHGVPAEKGQWYRISFRAKAEGLNGARVTVALQDTTTWRSCLDYQRFVPQDEWKEFGFVVQSKATVTTKSRFQIWHDKLGTLWLAQMRVAPCDPPSQGRWASGLYLDTPAPMDDPYRFFRW